MADSTESKWEVQVIVSGGVIESIIDIPPGMRIVVLDFDLAKVPTSETVKTNSVGQEYVEQIWEG
jgi:hypothetical protein